ncbi:MAG: hypothetical protein HC787_07425 [Nostocaceae cyanobacterium CSU_2_110]|nr:hypothetical protein [Nostocaceae cyanobacterium CSU_2_110]
MRLDIKPANIKDISEKFLIPEKLYGRETEVQQLLAAFEQVSNGDNELILVAGFFWNWKKLRLFYYLLLKLC